MYHFAEIDIDQEILDRARLALSDQATKNEILELFNSDEEPEIVFLAGANPALDAVDIEKLALEIPKNNWGMSFYSVTDHFELLNAGKISGLSCNPNTPDWLLQELISLGNYCSIVRANCEIKLREDGTQIQISGDPGMRLVLGQQQEYSNLLNEARSRKTESSRLLEIYQMKLMDIQYRNGYPQTGGYEWYEDVYELYLLHATKKDREDSRFRDDALYQQMDPAIAETLATKPILSQVVRSLTLGENHQEFSYVCAEIAANPQATFRIPSEELDLVLTVFDQLSESIQPVLFKWLELMLFEIDNAYEVATLQWIDLIKSMRFESNLYDAIERLESHLLLDSSLHSEIDSHDASEFTGLIEPEFLQEELAGLHEVIVRVAPYLGGTDSDVLRAEFEIESNCIKQAILLNPYCPEDVRDMVSKLGSDLFVPTRLEMARFSAYAGFYIRVQHWLGTEVTFDELFVNCDSHVVEAVKWALND
jgi:hypothetical protein